MDSIQFTDFLALVIPTSAAFIVAYNTTSLVQSLQSNILFPLISLTPGINSGFGNGKILLEPAKQDDQGNVVSEAVYLQYGAFLTALLTFVLILIIVYIFIITTYKVTEGKIDATRKL